MTTGARPTFSRRTFLKVSAVLSALTLRFGPPLAVASALPLVGAHVERDADRWPALSLKCDVALLPAYSAVELVGQRQARGLNGPPGRAHDPEGAFTVPHKLLIATVAYRGATPIQPLFEHLWSREALWPRFGRLALGVALLLKGHSPNTVNLEVVEEAARALHKLQPRFVDEPAAALEAGEGAVALIQRDATRLPVSGLPAEGRLLIEYDWLVPRTSSQPKAAAAFIRRQPQPFRLKVPAPYTTLTPLPELARTRYAELWKMVAG